MAVSGRRPARSVNLYLDERAWSYVLAPRLVPGTPCHVKRPVIQYGLMVLQAGERVTVESVTNAGFNGYTAAVRDEQGNRIVGFSAGALELA